MTSEFDVNKKCDWLLLTEIFEHFDWLDPVTIMNPSIFPIEIGPSRIIWWQFGGPWLIPGGGGGIVLRWGWEMF